MNRYRTLPGLGPQKATASTERPYASRPSRTQQLLNPKLAPKLASDAPNNLLNSKGVADQQLAEAQASRAKLVQEPEDRGRSPTPDSSDSVSTISTNKSHSRSRSRSRERGDDYFTASPPSLDRLGLRGESLAHIAKADAIAPSVPLTEVDLVLCVEVAIAAGLAVQAWTRARSPSRDGLSSMKTMMLQHSGAMRVTAMTLMIRDCLSETSGVAERSEAI
ncbi:hypothetical protein AYO21_07132 [Fonsecaea monophora]|uniref:Uncharacterized protein n=1 Tax=Fonsecaea monophora TaxID=254056 RepID=A0A177F486_9EURO|nr:hypothetical protein AYO21_07132 [Fonsecaea monophora]OAG38626.1 hypothetical protein AYO21_07132 [Fonsecaea monophora]